MYSTDHFWNLVIHEISGASSGIGQGIATEYAKYGPLLALTGRSMERLEETKKLCIESGLQQSNVSFS